MNVQQKLEVFSQTALKEAEQRRKRTLSETQMELDWACDDAKKKAEKKSADAIKQETYKIEQYVNKELIGVQTEVKKGLIQVRTQLSDDVFKNVVQKIDMFRHTPEYEEYLVKGINNTIDEFGKDITIFLCDADISLKERLEAKTSVPVKKDEYDFVAGFRVFVNDLKISIDNSIESKINEARSTFNYLRITE